MEQFDKPSGFLAWLAKEDGRGVEFPFPENIQFTVEISKDKVRLTSGFYNVEAGGDYGAPMITGHLVEFGSQMVSGFVKFGFKDGRLQKLERRRLTSKDSLGQDETLAAVTNDAHPDRVNEPNAVVFKSDDFDAIRGMTPEQRYIASEALRDGVELIALRELFRYVDEPNG